MGGDFGRFWGVDETHGTPELLIIPPRYDRSFILAWSDCFADQVVGSHQFLRVRAVDAVFRRFAHGYDEDVAGEAVEG